MPMSQKEKKTTTRARTVAAVSDGRAAGVMSDNRNLTAETITAALGRGATSMTKIWHSMGGSGSVSGSVANRMRSLVPDIGSILAANKAAGAGSCSPTAAAIAKPANTDEALKPTGHPKPSGEAEAAWPHDPRNPFRRGSAYGTCFDILAAHPLGLPREKLVEALAAATGKDAKHAGYDAQVLLSARGNDEGLNPFDGPRHRSCKAGFWVERTNSHVKLVVG